MSTAEIMTVEHPGVFILEELEARGWEQVDLAYILGMTVQQLNPILKGKHKITPDMAVALGDAFDVSPEFFLNLQKLYDLQLAKRPDPGVRTRANWVKTFPVREMIRRGWIQDTEADLLDLQMMRFFNTNSVQDIPFIGDGEVYKHAAKKTGYDEITPVQLVWLHRVRVIAQMMESPAYSKEKLLKALPDIRAHMNDKDDLAELPHLLWKCGVRLVVVEPLAGAKIDGVCTWLDDQPVIGISTLRNRMDNLCFVIRHEIEHILNEDGKRETYTHVDNFDDDRDVNQMPDEEKRADEAAAEFLIPQQKLTSFMARKGKFISEKDVMAFAARHHIHPSIVIGQIQRRRYNAGDERAFAWLRKHLSGIRNYFMDWDYRDGWGYVAPVGL
jgi:HTH-type transcriptional regulator/antitoxin HigA